MPTDKAPRVPAPEQLRAENELNRDFAAVFAPDNIRALRVLRFLEASTIGQRVAPTSPDALLRHVEGQRSVVHMILDRIVLGQKNLPAVPATGEPQQ